MTNVLNLGIVCILPCTLPRDKFNDFWHCVSLLKGPVERMKTVMLRFCKTIHRWNGNGELGAPVNYFLPLKYVSLSFYLRPKLKKSACDSIIYKNGKDSDLRNGFIKSYQ